MFFVKNIVTGAVYPAFETKEAALFTAEKIFEGVRSYSPFDLFGKYVMKRAIGNLASGPKQYKKKSTVNTTNGVEEIRVEKPFVLYEDGKIVNPNVFGTLSETEYPDMTSFDFHELKRPYVPRVKQKGKDAHPKGKGVESKGVCRKIHYVGTLREKEDPESREFGITGYRSRKAVNAWDVEPVATYYKSWKAEKKGRQWAKEKDVPVHGHKPRTDILFRMDPWAIYMQDAS